MFERKNQNILSEHYTKLVDHDADGDSEDEFITLKRADHDLDDGMALPESEFTSKRKQKLALSKKALGKYGGKGHKLVFDDEGNPHEVYEMKDVTDVFKDEREVMEAGRQFAEAERGKMKEVDVVDKAEAKEKKREKKRKRKEREREVRSLLYLLSTCRTDVICRVTDLAMTMIRAMSRWGPLLRSSQKMMATRLPSSTCRQTRKGRKASSRDLLRRSRGRNRARRPRRWRKKKSLRCRCCVADDSHTEWNDVCVPWSSRGSFTIDCTEYNG